MVHMGDVGAFTPPSAAQRYAFVAGVLRAAGARRVADLGCGDGALLAFLAASGDEAPRPPALPHLTPDAAPGGDLAQHHHQHPQQQQQQQQQEQQSAASNAGAASELAAASGGGAAVAGGGGSHSTGANLEELVGIDISATALARAQKTLQVALAPCAPWHSCRRPTQPGSYSL